MSQQKDIQNLDEPDLQIAGLQIWIHGRERSGTSDYWDDNWLRATVHCSAARSDVWAEGSILHLTEIAAWLAALENMAKTLTGVANMECMEPYLNVSMEAGKHGAIQMTVDLTPDHMTQKHQFKYDIDQSYLSALTSSCRHILETYPIVGK